MSGKVLTINSNGMTQERPVSFETVAAAEAASFLPDEICSVLETRRFYQFDSGSSETRDGVRVLSPAGGGRLLMTAPVMTDAEVAAAIRTASASQSGLMSTAYASKLDGISAGADATGFRGNVTTSQRNALTGLSAGHWVRNTDWPYGQNVETWSGSIWVRQGCLALINRYGSNLPYGCLVVPSTSYDLSVTLTNVSASNSVLGINTTPDAPNNTEAAIALIGSGLIVDALVYGYGSVSRNEFAFSHASYGFCRGNASASVGAFGRWLTEYTAPSGGGTTKLSLPSNAELY